MTKHRRNWHVWSGTGRALRDGMTTTTMYRDGETTTVAVDGAYATVVQNGQLLMQFPSERANEAISGAVADGWVRALTVAVLVGGDATDAGGAIWLDLSSNNWLALVAHQEAAEELSENCGATLISVEEWDCGPFGDENVFDIEASEPGVITRVGGGPVDSGMRCALPTGWSWGE